MPKFTLIAEHDDFTRTTVEFEKDFLPEVLLHMDMFLRGTGFIYDGSLSIEEWEDYSVKDKDSDEPEIEPKQESFYFKDQNGTVNGTVNTITISAAAPSKCFICGLTKEELGAHTCYDSRCPSKVTFSGPK